MSLMKTFMEIQQQGHSDVKRWTDIPKLDPWMITDKITTWTDEKMNRALNKKGVGGLSFLFIDISSIKVIAPIFWILVYDIHNTILYLELFRHIHFKPLSVISHLVAGNLSETEKISISIFINESYILFIFLLFIVYYTCKWYWKKKLFLSAQWI